MICSKSKASMSWDSLGVRCFIVRRFPAVPGWALVPLGIFNPLGKLGPRDRRAKVQAQLREVGSIRFARRLWNKRTSDDVTYLTPAKSTNPLCFRSSYFGKAGC